MEIDRLAAELHRQGDGSVTQLRKCVIIVAERSVHYQTEVRMLENNPTDLDSAEIERTVGNQYIRLLRQQQESKTFSVSKGNTTVKANRGQKKRRPRNRLEGNCFNCRRKCHSAEDCRSAKKTKNQEMLPPTKRVEVEPSATSVGVRTTLRTSTMA